MLSAQISRSRVPVGRHRNVLGREVAGDVRGADAVARRGRRSALVLGARHLVPGDPVGADALGPRGASAAAQPVTAVAAHAPVLPCGF